MCYDSLKGLLEISMPPVPQNGSKWIIRAKNIVKNGNDS